MKKWLQNLSGAVMASLLAITLNGKAYAEDPQPVPAEASTEVVETAPAPVSASEPAPALVPETAPAPVAAPAPAPEPAPAPAPAAETVPVASAASAAVEAVPSPAVPETPAASTEAPVAAPKATESVAEEPAIVEAPAVLKTPVAADIPAVKTPAAVSEAPTAVDVTPVIEEQAEVKLAVDETTVEIQAVEKEKTVELEEPAVKESTRESANEIIPEDDKEPLQEIPAKDASSDVPVKPATPKKLSLTKDGLSSDGESGAAANLLSVQEDSEKTGSLEEKEEEQSWEQLEEQPEEQPEEPLIKLAKRGITADESGIDEGEGETKAAATRGTGGEETNTKSDPVRVFSQIADDRYAIINHLGDESISAKGNVTVLAAGMNHISSISGTGTVSIAGTGILLVDSIEGNVQLLTLTDIYQSGSVALFVRQNENEYILVNGSVPGILDEDYLVEGVTLIMPDKTSLLLCGTGAMPEKDEEGNVTGVSFYYHGTDHGHSVSYEEIGNAVEHIGKLTIAKQAALIVQKGASVVLENLKSLAQLDSFDGDRHPELIIENGGKLTIEEGAVVGVDGCHEGNVTIDGAVGTLTGQGSMSAGNITVNNPATISNPDSSSGVRLSAVQLEINGEGTVENLKIKNATVYPDSSKVKITDLDSIGDCTIVLPKTSQLGISSVQGKLHLSQREYYHFIDDSPVINQEDNVTLGTVDYSDNYAHVISGTISGSGTICFDAGMYQLRNVTKGGGISFSNEAGGLVYDYSGVMAASLSPLHIQPSAVTRADEASNGVIPVAAAVLFEKSEVEKVTRLGSYSPVWLAGIKKVTVQRQVDLTEKVADQENPVRVANLIATKKGDHWELSLDDLKTLAKNNMQKVEGNHCGVVVEFLHKNAAGTELSTSFYTWDMLKGSLNVDDVCLVRISYIGEEFNILPSSGETQVGMSYTGSGVLGGSGAGSVSLGNANHVVINIGNTDSETNDDTGDDLSDNTDNNTVTPPEPEPIPEPDNNAEETEPVPLVGYVEENPEAAPLVWVKLAPTMNNASASPAETQYVVLALEGEKTLEELGGKATVTMEYTPPAEYAGKTLYVVFRNEDGTLTAIPAIWSELTGLLSFITDRLGTFMVVGLDFDIDKFEGFPEDFYKALAQIPELKYLVFAEYSPV